MAELNLEIAQARLEDAAEDLSKSVISAPHDGVITRMDVLEGQVISGATSVSNGTGLMTIAELDELYMEANINEVDVEMLYLGQKAFLRFDAIPEFEAEGTINVIAPSARKDGNVRVFPVEVFLKLAISVCDQVLALPLRCLLRLLRMQLVFSYLQSSMRRG